MLTDTQIDLMRLAFAARGMPIPPGKLLGSEEDPDGVRWPLMDVDATSEYWNEVEAAFIASLNLPPDPSPSTQEN